MPLIGGLYLLPDYWPGRTRVRRKDARPELPKAGITHYRELLNKAAAEKRQHYPKQKSVGVS